MKKFLLGFILGLLFAGLTIVILVVAAVRLGGSRKPVVADNSTLLLHLEGDLPEQAPVDYGIPFLAGQQPLSVAENWQVLRNAAADARIKAVVLEPRGLSVGWAKLEELRGDIVNFKKSGKPVYAYLRGAGMREYYVASAADRIYISPEDELDVKGLRAELTFVKGTLDKLGVQMEFEHMGKYKDAPDMFTKTGSSPETREVINGLLDQFYGDFVASVAEGRQKTLGEVRALIDNGPFVGPEALHGGLVDELAYEDQVFAKLKDKVKSGDARINEHDYARIPAPAGVEGATRIALVIGEGDIVRGGTNDGADQDLITTAGMTKLIRQVRDDNSIKGVILRIDSPGGDGIASDDILHEAKLLSQKKPTVISMSDLAASGGYFIAMTGDPLIAYRATETGSIGVFFGKPNLKGLYDKIGIRKELMTRGRFADIDTESAPLNDAQRTKLRAEIEQFYKGFVERVAGARKRTYDDVEPLAQGRVWTGAQAKQNGLVDELGGLDRAIELVKQRAKIAATEKITLVPYPPRRTLLQVIMDREQLTELESRVFESAFESRAESRLAALAGDAAVPSVIHSLLRGALAQGGILSRMPYSVTVR
ncbi:MAG TPA: signal peptide peptidase SppA [Bryobacteraceae bacterium]|nr:signal peptide peptidase SppA [Bryobacteraceae bacterium]